MLSGPAHRPHAIARSLMIAASLVALLGAGFAAADHSHLQSLPQAWGVNYSFADTGQHPDYISSAPLEFRLTGSLFGGDLIDITSTNASSCSGPCNLRVAPSRELAPQVHSGHPFLNCDVNDDQAVCRLAIHRFAQNGRHENPGFDWLVTMVDDEKLLTGTMTTTVQPDGSLLYPAPAVLGGHMIVTVQRDGMPQMRLRSRVEPLFTGDLLGWPPHGSTFSLSNGPIEYFLESQVQNPQAKPIMTIQTNQVRLGTESAEFFAVRPQVTVTSGRSGNQVQWTDTGAQIQSAEIGRYYVYRSETPNDLPSWQRIATVPASVTSYLDAAGQAGSHYLVSHATQLRFGYWYEGIFDEPTPASLRGF